MTKRTHSPILFVFLFFALSLLHALPAQAVGFSLSVNPYGGERDAIDTVRCTLSEQGEQSGKQQYMLYLPADCDGEKLTVYFSGASDVTVDGMPLRNGEPAACFPETRREFTLCVDGRTYPLVVLRSENHPAMYLSTETGSLTTLHADLPDYSERGHLRVREKGEQTADAKMKSIKLRGNWTRKHPKKPYAITLYDKISLFGMEKAKKWVLLTNYLDYTLLRNGVSQTLAEAYGLAYTPEFQTVDLYINGEYQGNYQLFEKVELGENRIAVPSLEKANRRVNLGVEPAEQSWNSVPNYYTKGYRRWVELPNEPEDITGTYLLELDMSERAIKAPCFFLTDNSQIVTIKSPKYASKAEVNYIADLFSDAHAALVSEDGYNEKGKHYSEYFDLDSLARMYLLEEYTLDLDAALSSAFFLKLPGDDRLYAVAPWDFDSGLFNDNDRFGIDFTEPRGWYAAVSSIPPLFTFSDTSIPTLFRSAMRHTEFRDMVSAYWEELAPLTKEIIEKDLTRFAAENHASALMDAYRWGFSYLSYAGEDRSVKQGSVFLQAADYETQSAAYDRVVGQMAEKCRIRFEELNTGFSADASLVFFESGAGEAYAVFEPMLKIGDGLPVPVYSDVIWIDRWNTKPDRTGQSYLYKDTLPLTERTMVLYPG